MKMSKKQVMATIGALGLTAGVLAGCSGQQESDSDDTVKVVDSEGNTVYIDEDEFEDQQDGNGMMMFMLFSSWNGNNHSKLKTSKGFKGKTYSSKPSTTSAKSGSGVGKSSSTKSGGFGG